MKIIIEKKDYNMGNDCRSLIPYVVDSAYGCRIGFVTKRGTVAIKPYYSCVYDDFYSKDDVIVVGIQNGFHSKDDYVKQVIDIKGNNIFKELFRDVFMSDDRQLFSVENSKGEHAVLDRNKNIIVPYGKYKWIGGYKGGFARLKNESITNGIKEGNKKWGVINAEGKEIIPCCFYNIHDFYNDNKDFVEIDFFPLEKVESIITPGFLQELPCPTRTRKVSFDDLRKGSDSIGDYLVNEMQIEKDKYIKRIDEYNRTLPENREMAKRRLYDKPSDWAEYQRDIRRSVPDAYEGEQETHWNTE